VRRGVYGAQRKNEDAPCEGPRDEQGRSVCGRHCGAENRVHHPCSRHPKNSAHGRCNNHGADSPIGPENGQWTDGARSKYAAIFTGDALKHYELALEDPRYLELREDLAVLDTLFVEEMKRARVGEGGALWEELGKAWQRNPARVPIRARGRLVEACSSPFSTQAGMSALALGCRGPYPRDPLAVAPLS